jgi:hypothetical protein
MLRILYKRIGQRLFLYRLGHVLWPGVQQALEGIRKKEISFIFINI